MGKKTTCYGCKALKNGAVIAKPEGGYTSTKSACYFGVPVRGTWGGDTFLITPQDCPKPKSFEEFERIKAMLYVTLKKYK